MVSTPALSQQHGLPILHGARIEMVWKFVKIHPSHSLLSCDACTPNSKLLEARELDKRAAQRTQQCCWQVSGFPPAKFVITCPSLLGKCPGSDGSEQERSGKDPLLRKIGVCRQCRRNSGSLSTNLRRGEKC